MEKKKYIGPNNKKIDLKKSGSHFITDTIGKVIK